MTDQPGKPDQPQQNTPNTEQNSDGTQVIPPPPTTRAPQAHEMGAPHQTDVPPAPSAPAASNPLMDQINLIFFALRGRVLDVFSIAQRQPLIWIITAVAGLLLAGSVVATTVARSTGALGHIQMSLMAEQDSEPGLWTIFSIIIGMFAMLLFVSENKLEAIFESDGPSSYANFSAGGWFAVFGIAIAAILVIMLLRVLALHLTMLFSGRKQSFMSSLNMTAAAYSIYLPVLFVLILLALIPGKGWFVFVGISSVLFWAVPALLAEVMLYVGINRYAPGSRSPMPAYFAATSLWSIAVLGLFILGVSIVQWMAETKFDDFFGGMF